MIWLQILLWKVAQLRTLLSDLAGNDTVAILHNKLSHKCLLWTSTHKTLIKACTWTCGICPPNYIVQYQQMTDKALIITAKNQTMLEKGLWFSSLSKDLKSCSWLKSQVTEIIYLYVLSKVFFTERVKILIEEDTVLKNGLCDNNRKDSNLHDFFKGPKNL